MTSEDIHMIFLAPRDDNKDSFFIVENARSQMMGLPAFIYERRVKQVPAEAQEQQLLARSVLHEENVDLVFWCDQSPCESVLFMYQTSKGHQLVERKLEGTGREGIADAIGLITRATVELFLDTGALNPTIERPAPESSKEVPEQEPETGLEALWHIDLAYVLQMATAAPQFTHGGRLSGGLFLSRHISIFSGIEFSGPSASRGGTAEVTRMRIPAHIGLSAMGSAGNWRIGGGATAVFSSLNITSRSLDASVTVTVPYRLFEFSMEFLVMARSRIYKWLWFSVAAGGELFPEKRTYEIVNGPVLFEEFKRFQPKLIVGLAGQF